MIYVPAETFRLAAADGLMAQGKSGQSVAAPL
jgi:hypothetical protein